MNEDEKAPCCANHIPPFRGLGWCSNARFDGCEPCCPQCPDRETWEQFDARDDTITGYPDHYIINGDRSSCDCGGDECGESASPKPL